LDAATKAPVGIETMADELSRILFAYWKRHKDYDEAGALEEGEFRESGASKVIL